jgi:hypothetical protein
MVSIGVTGHRFLDEGELLNTAVDRVVSRIEQKYPGEEWSVVSSLAEGADRLVVRRLLNTHPALALLVPLPLPAAEYLKDFPTAESQEEFQKLLALARHAIQPAEFATREEAYRAAGIAMLDASDVLVALWNGRPAGGVGGTGEIVELARQRKMPIAWVYCNNRNLLTVETSQDLFEEGTLFFERI